MNYKYINFHSMYVLVKSEYIGYEYEYMTHKLYEYLKNTLEYRVLLPQVWYYIYICVCVDIYIYTIYIYMYTCIYILYIYI